MKKVMTRRRTMKKMRKMKKMMTSRRTMRKMMMRWHLVDAPTQEGHW